MEGDADSSDLPHVNVVFFGPCGCGKSTMAGRLIADSGAIEQENLERISDEALSAGQPDRCYAWILDKLKCERDRGHTMHVALWRLASRRCRFTIIDAPGHNDFASDIVTAMSQADIAVLVVPAMQEDLESEGQLREHTLLAYTLGLRQLVVCVNKMDTEAVSYSEDNFDSTCSLVRQNLDAAGLKTHDVFFDVHFIPTSGWIGDNVISRSDYTPWYCGPTLVEAIDDAVASHFKPERPLRFPLREVMKVGGKGTVVVGQVATGSLKVGTRLVFAPGGACAQVSAITMHHECLDEAICGNIVNVTVDVDRSELRPGMVGALPDESPAIECSSFLAQVIVLNNPRAGEIRAGCELSVACHMSQVLCVFEQLLSRTDRRTGIVLEMMPKSLHAGDAAVVRLRPRTPLCVEPFEEYPPLGKFSVHDTKLTVAVGVVQRVDHASEQPLPIKPTKSPSSASRHKASKVKPGEEKRSKPAKVSKPKDPIRDVGERGRASCGANLSADSGEDGPSAARHEMLSRGSIREAFSADSGEECLVRPGLASNAAVGATNGFSVGYPAAKSSSTRVPLGTSPFAAFGAVAHTRKKRTPDTAKEEPALSSESPDSPAP